MTKKERQFKLANIVCILYYCKDFMSKEVENKLKEEKDRLENNDRKAIL